MARVGESFGFARGRLGPEVWEGYLACLRTVSRQLQGNVSLAESLPAVLEALRRAAWADRCALYRIEGEGESCVARLFQVAPVDGSGGPVRGFVMGDELAGCVARLAAGESVRSDVEGLPEAARNFFAARGARWLLAVPIMVGGMWEGILCFTARGERGWSYEEELLLATAAAEIAAAIGRRRAEQAMVESEQRYHDLFENVADLVQCVGPDGCLLYVNRAWREALGYREEEVAGLHFTDVVPAAERDHCRAVFGALSTGRAQRNVEIRLKALDGREVVVEGNLNVLMEGGKMVHTRGIFRDVTERKRAEAERDRLAAAVKHAAEAILIADRDGTIRYVNPAFERMTGYSASEAIGKTPRLLKSDQQPPEFYKQMWETILRGEVWHGHYTNRCKDGRLIQVEQTVSPICREGGDVESFTSLMRDITREVELEERLRQAQKMEALGTLAGGIAHDFNNVLAAILGNTELALMDLEQGSDTVAVLREVESASFRARDLVAQILTFARQRPGERQPVCLGPIVKEVAKLLRATLPVTIELLWEVDEVGSVVADPTEMYQVVMNLCVNAAQAMDEVGRLRVALSLSAGDEQRVRLVVEDTGCGMDETTLQRIFEPYFTTKQKGVGTGLGLATVHGIIDGCGGTIQVESVLGEGSCFTILLPVSGETELRQGAEERSEPPRGGEHILVVDDQPSVAAVHAKMLTRLGYRVTQESSPQVALERVREDPAEIDLVLSDQTMPQLTGDALCTALGRVRPDLPVILCTGYSERLSEQHARAVGAVALLYKPVEAWELACAVRRTLDEVACKQEHPRV